MKSPSLNHPPGFTLMEIMVVIIIIGVIAGMGLPKYFKTIEKMKSGEGVQVLTAVLGAQTRYRLENGAFADGSSAGELLSDLDVSFPGLKHFDQPTLANSDPVASIDRSSGAYTLSIDADGTLHCADLVGTSCSGISRTW